MKTLFCTLLICLCVWTASGDGTPVVPATQAEVNAGVNGSKFVSPKTLGGWGGGMNVLTNNYATDVNFAGSLFMNNVTYPDSFLSIDPAVGQASIGDSQQDRNGTFVTVDDFGSQVTIRGPLGIFLSGSTHVDNSLLVGGAITGNGIGITNVPAKTNFITLTYIGATNVLVDFSQGNYFSLAVTANTYLIPTNINYMGAGGAVVNVTNGGTLGYTFLFNTNICAFPSGVVVTMPTNIGAWNVISLLKYPAANVNKVAVLQAVNFQ